MWRSKYIKYVSKNCLLDVLDVYGVKNLVYTPSCRISRSTPTAIDPVITNVPDRLKDITTPETGPDHCHEMVCFAARQFVKATCPKRITYRSFKHSSEAAYVRDVCKAPFLRWRHI